MLTAWIKQLDEFSINKKICFFFVLFLCLALCFRLKRATRPRGGSSHGRGVLKKGAAHCDAGSNPRATIPLFLLTRCEIWDLGGDRPAAERSITQTTTPSSHAVAQCVCVCLLLCAHVSKSTRVWTFADRSKTIPAEGLNDKRGKEKSSDAKNDVCSCADGVLPGLWSLWVSFCLVVKCVASLNAVIHNVTMQQHKVQ